MCWSSSAAGAKTAWRSPAQHGCALRVATITAGQKIACPVELIRFSLKTHFDALRQLIDARFAAAARREEGATMIKFNVFGVCQAGDAGSRHAAHAAAASAASHKRIAAATERPWNEALPR